MSEMGMGVPCIWEEWAEGLAADPGSGGSGASAGSAVAVVGIGDAAALVFLRLNNMVARALHSEDRRSEAFRPLASLQSRR